MGLPRARCGLARRVGVRCDPRARAGCERQRSRQRGPRPHQEAERAAWARREAELTADREVDRRTDREHQAEQFRALAADALAMSSEQFLALAHQRLAAAQQGHEAGLREREAAVRALVEPLAATLQAVQRELGSAEVTRAEGAAALAEQVRAMRESAERLRGETARLVTALRSSHVRGTLGRAPAAPAGRGRRHAAARRLRRAGQVRTDDGPLRPDMVIRLAGGKRVVVDAKVAFLGFLEASEAPTRGPGRADGGARTPGTRARRRPRREAVLGAAVAPRRSSS